VIDAVFLPHKAENIKNIPFRIYLGYVYFAETENFLLKVL